MRRSIVFCLLVMGILCSYVTAAVAAVVDVSIVDFAFKPQTVTINTGDTVRWTDNGVHSTTSGTACPRGDGKWDSGVLSTGQTFLFTFTQSGTYPYFCSVHCFTGTVIVNGGTAIIPAPAGQNTVFFTAGPGPVLGISRNTSMPIGIGGFAHGGGFFTGQIAIEQYEVPVDMFVAFTIDVDPQIVVNIAPDLTFNNLALADVEQALSTGVVPEGVVPWMSNVSGPVNETLFTDVPISSFQSGVYTVFLLVTPHGGTLADFDLYQTSFLVP